jgi:hypothetical protein
MDFCVNKTISSLEADVAAWVMPAATLLGKHRKNWAGGDEHGQFSGSTRTARSSYYRRPRLSFATVPPLEYARRRWQPIASLSQRRGGSSYQDIHADNKASASARN